VKELNKVVEVNGIDFDVYFNYEPGYPNTEKEEGEPYQLEITGVYLDGFDGYDLVEVLAEDVLVMIEERLLEKL